MKMSKKWEVKTLFSSAKYIELSDKFAGTAYANIGLSCFEDCDSPGDEWEPFASGMIHTDGLVQWTSWRREV